MGFVV